MITNYLIELIKDNECVIVPEFGAFISKRHSATIDYVNHRFLPPYKEIVFNNKLKNNDDLIADYISNKEKISKEDSLTKIQNFVNQSEAVLGVKHELVLDGFGKIRKFGDDYVFSLIDDMNLLGDSFCLTEFNVQPVFRTETYQVIKEKIVVEQKAKNTEYTLAIESVKDSTDTTTRKRPKMLKTMAFATMAFFFLFVINWTTDKSDSNMASWNPFLYSSPNEYFLRFFEANNTISMEENFAASDFQETQEHSQDQVLETVEPEILPETMIAETIEPVVSVEAPVAETIEPEVTVEVPVAETIESEVLPEIHYYIIGGSFQAEQKAKICLDNIKKKGFENASLLEKNDKGYIRVYYESFVEKAEALPRLEIIKKEYDESAWLLFQK